MTDVRELQTGDIISIDAEPFSESLWRVSDVTVKDIGITETYAVALVCAAEGDDTSWVTTGTTADSQTTFERVAPYEEQHIVNWNAVTIE